MATQRAYASGTSVSVSRSKEQIEAELRRMGATRRAFLDDDTEGRAAIMFERGDLRYRLLLPLPLPDEYRFVRVNQTGSMRKRGNSAMLDAWQQVVNERWRALAEYVKALRVGWEAGIIRIEEALLSSVVLPDGQTVGEWVEPQLPEAYAARAMPPLLPGVSGGLAQQPLLLEEGQP